MMPAFENKVRASSSAIFVLVTVNEATTVQRSSLTYQSPACSSPPAVRAERVGGEGASGYRFLRSIWGYKGAILTGREWLE
ncbi:hypothetical protein BDZ89DRAFT_173102 [Hymenopellis radicata]|nr:hypothetical protein BDZ89DRAFT_173102 [Hymenopellis radicata]